MHTIKFRLIKDNKIIGYEEHRLLDDGMGNLNVFIYHSRTGHPMSWREIVSCPKEYLKHDDKDRFTGFEDKNGKEIYEGDLIQNYSGRICRVEWHKHIGCWDAIPVMSIRNTNADDFKPPHWFNVKVVGNRWENEESSKEEK